VEVTKLNSQGRHAPPRGFRDILPTEARELHLIEQSLGDTFAAYGYVAIEPPMVEYAEGEPAPERLIQFLDRDGRLVALRPDLTTAVARLVAHRYREMNGTLRLSYFAPVFREQPALTAGEREVVQAGVELIGASGPLGDAEVLALLAESLERCGLRLDGSTIHVGHVGIMQRLFAGLPDDARAATIRALRDGDHVGALRRARDAGMPDDDADRARRTLEVAGRATLELPGAEVSELGRVMHLARERWPGRVESWGVPNVGLIPTLPYYTGIVFEALHPDVGMIASGGRYDLLSGEFGPARPATGFAIDVLRLHRALFAQGWRPKAPRPVVALRPTHDERAAMRCAAALQAAGVCVAIGDVAETAGIPLVCADVVDEERVRLGGEVIDVASLARRFRS
jgi:ATP phosphoribosyltransferase regulatory subunit